MKLCFGFRRCGLLTIDEPPYADLSNVITNVRGVGQECLQLTADEINKRFPGLNLSSQECGALEPATGFIQAELALKSLQVRISNIKHCMKSHYLQSGYSSLVCFTLYSLFNATKIAHLTWKVICDIHY